MLRTLPGCFFLDPAFAEDLCAIKTAVENDADDGVECVGGKLFGARHEIAGGVVDESVDFADLRLGRFAGGFDRGVITNVTGCVGGGATGALDFFADQFEWLGPAADYEETRAEAGKMQSHGAAETGAHHRLGKYSWI